MSTFQLFYEVGVHHILAFEGLDHILFILALCSIYLLRDWRKVLILITAFTLGHTLTLALVTLNFFKAQSNIIEFLIPVTIFVTAASNIWKGSSAFQRGPKFQLNYLYAGFFGLIHGMAFANELRALLGKDDQVVTKLLAFNLGIEIGQIVVVGVFLLAGYIFIGLFGINRRDWNLVINSAIAGISLLLIIEAKFW
jgi:hypothetical protein